MEPKNLGPLFLGTLRPDTPPDGPGGYWYCDAGGLDWLVKVNDARTWVLGLVDDSGIAYGDYEVTMKIEPEQYCACGCGMVVGGPGGRMAWVGKEHPHIGGHGNICLGSAETLVSKLIESGELPSAVAVARDVFEHPNWGSLLVSLDYIKDGRRALRCASCGGKLESYRSRCGQCARRVCQSCSLVCPRTGRAILCRSCLVDNGKKRLIQFCHDCCEVRPSRCPHGSAYRRLREFINAT